MSRKQIYLSKQKNTLHTYWIQVSFFYQINTHLFQTRHRANKTHHEPVCLSTITFGLARVNAQVTDFDLKLFHLQTSFSPKPSASKCAAKGRDKALISDELGMRRGSPCWSRCKLTLDCIPCQQTEVSVPLWLQLCFGLWSPPELSRWHPLWYEVAI